jgi:Fe-S oxidoreductase
MEEQIGKRINSERTEEGISTGAERMGVACPFCYIMLDDGAKAAGERIEVTDVSEIVAGSMARTAVIHQPEPVAAEASEE